MATSVICGCNNQPGYNNHLVLVVFKESLQQIFSQINPPTQSLLNILSNTTAMMIIHPIVIVALLLLAVGSNAKLLCGTNREHTQECNLGTCKCKILCQQCYKQGVDNAQCQRMCAISKEPNCANLCNDFIKGNDNRDNTDIPIPFPPAKPSTTSPTNIPIPFQPTKPLTPSPTCYCVNLCESCKGNGLADCHTVCEYATLLNNKCISMCNTALHDVDNP